MCVGSTYIFKLLVSYSILYTVVIQFVSTSNESHFRIWHYFFCLNVLFKNSWGDAVRIYFPQETLVMKKMTIALKIMVMKLRLRMRLLMACMCMMVWWVNTMVMRPFTKTLTNGCSYVTPNLRVSLSRCQNKNFLARHVSEFGQLSHSQNFNGSKIWVLLFVLRVVL